MPADASQGVDPTHRPPRVGHPGGEVPVWRRTRTGATLFRAFRHCSLVLDGRIEGSGAVGVLLRLWAWQVWRRAVRRPVVIRCAEGSLLLAPSWSRATSMIAGTGLTERDDALFVLDLLRPGDLFVDVGANVGFYTMIAGRRGARVEAFEPTPEACAACERGIELNDIRALATVHRLACGAEPGMARFTTGHDISNHLAGSDEPGIDVDVSTLDAELAEHQASMTMFKVDAEGHDLDVLRGGMVTIERLRPVILVEIWTGGAGPLALVERFGYRPHAYDPGARSLTEIQPGYRHGGNMLLVPDSKLEAVRDRVESSQRPTLRPPSIKWMP